jgi:uncharacterized membrane protein
MIQQIRHAIDVDVPVRTAYDQWTQFEDFPMFMDAVVDVSQVDDSRLRWSVEIGRVGRELVTEIVEQEPDRRVAWTTVAGPDQGGVVTFHELDDGSTRMMMQIDVEPHGVVERLGALFGTIERQVVADLERFKSFIEARGDATGAWRGRVENPAYDASAEASDSTS